MNIEYETCEMEQFVYDKFPPGLWDTKTISNNIFILKKVDKFNDGKSET